MRAVAGKLLNCDVRDCEVVSGGSLSQVFRLTLADGTYVIAKGGPDPIAEADMLRAIRDAGAPAPQVLAVDQGCLVLEELPSDGRPSQAWPDIGAALACLHACIGRLYGWCGDYSFNEVAIANAQTSNWPQFWASQRLLPHVPYVGSDIAQRIESISAHIEDLLPADPPASLLHGDCWGGNILVSGGALSGFIDPACYYGHAEVDIAMLNLFDQPDESFYAAYGRLEPGHRERTAIYSLWPALVHVRLFGDAYIQMTDRFLTSAGH